MKTAFLIPSILLGTALFAIDFPLFEITAEDGSGIEKLRQLQSENANKKKFYTTHDTVNDEYDQRQLVTILLNEAVMKKVRELPLNKGMIVLKSHQLWWKYFDSTPSLPNINGTARGIFILTTDFARIKSRWKAVKLPYSQYLIYAKIANLCQVRMECGTYKMSFGEVCLTKNAAWSHDDEAVKIYGKYYNSFPTSILPETCLKTAEIYAAVLSAGKMLYLCIWNIDGIPLAVHKLAGIEKIASISFDAQRKISISAINNKKQSVQICFALTENKNFIHCQSNE